MTLRRFQGVRAAGLVVLGVVLLAAVMPVWSHNQLDVGINSKGQLMIETHIHQPYPLPESVFGGVPGYATASVGVESAFRDRPEEDFFTLPADADIDLIFVGADPDMYMYNFQGTETLEPGETWHCGLPFFHQHPLWQINPGVPAQTYAIQIKAHDINGNYTDSEVFTLLFTPKCDGDATVDGHVDIDDIFEVIGLWGPCANCTCDADLNADCVINIDDLFTVISNWEQCS